MGLLLLHFYLQVYSIALVASRSAPRVASKSRVLPNLTEVADELSYPVQSNMVMPKPGWTVGTINCDYSDGSLVGSKGMGTDWDSMTKRELEILTRDSGYV